MINYYLHLADADSEHFIILNQAWVYDKGECKNRIDAFKEKYKILQNLPSPLGCLWTG